MDSNKLVAFLGYTFNYPPLEDFLRVEGFTGEPSEEEIEDLMSSYVSAKDKGVELVFKLPDQVRESPGIVPKSTGKFVLVQIFLYPSDAGEYSAFGGMFPFGISRNDDRKSLSAKLGPPSFISDEQDGVVYSEAWDRGGVRFAVDYSIEDGAMSLLSFGLPFKRAQAS